MASRARGWPPGQSPGRGPMTDTAVHRRTYAAACRLHLRHPAPAGTRAPQLGHSHPGAPRLRPGRNRRDAARQPARIRIGHVQHHLAARHRRSRPAVVCAPIMAPTTTPGTIHPFDGLPLARKSLGWPSPHQCQRPNALADSPTPADSTSGRIRLPSALPRVSRSSRPVTCRSSSHAAHWSGTSGLTRIRRELFLPLPGRIHQEQNPARARAEEDRGLIPLEGLRLDIPIPEGRDEHGGLRLGFWHRFTGDQDHATHRLAAPALCALAPAAACGEPRHRPGGACAG